MHIPDGLLSLPTLVATGAASVGGIGTAVKKTREHLEDNKIPLLGVMGAFIFAAQMINFPVGLGTSGHLIGAFFAAVVLGPWASALVLSAILIIQSLFFGDGGILALGANIFNMAVLANFTGYYVYQLFKKNSKSYSQAGIIVGGCFSVVAAALAAAIEIVLSGRSELMIVLPPMMLWHVLIGIGEGLITLFLVSYIAKVRGDLLLQPITVKEEK
ncbi:energy-coupling factor ABC transporter permease [Geosporobacter ferrireducens]|uniref:Cobalamin biosynthesis protein CbiM n=1 Tax=Geosporobacter ferrireducens TaxID=1424294 RepID=A0A1D8GCN8_9FIRM|nr:energy-coupling factor ABC transporter permease [Geosporobacter ferrireducens]AOT68656.1 cobalamin biosynthesis protein CbiM [Geosporobacter ferrireducens]MTI54131.1 cobalamin biosynthesis protein CbiM [Geosporobacter ferrireducens]